MLASFWLLIVGLLSAPLSVTLLALVVYMGSNTLGKFFLSPTVSFLKFYIILIFWIIRIKF